MTPTIMLQETSSLKPLEYWTAKKLIVDKQQEQDGEGEEKVWVDEPLNNDVLLGKKRAAFNHIGNKKFRKVIGEYWKKYDDSKGRAQRSAIVVGIVRMLTSSYNVRFLKRDGDQNRWYVVDNMIAREKVAHAIRDAINMKRHADRKEAVQKKTNKRVAERCAEADQVAVSKINNFAVSRMAAPSYKGIVVPKKKTNQGHMSPTSTTEPPEEPIMDALPTPTSSQSQPSVSVTIMKPILDEGSDVRQEIQQAILAATAAAHHSSAPAYRAAVLEGQSAAMVGAFNVWASQNFI